LFAAWGVTLSDSSVSASVSASVPASASAFGSSNFTTDAGAQFVRLGGTVCVHNPDGHDLLPGPDDTNVNVNADANNAINTNADNASIASSTHDDSDNASKSSGSESDMEQYTDRVGDKDATNEWKPLSKPRGEWLTPQEVRERFVDISEGQALVLACAQQGTATLKTRLAAPLVVPAVSDTVDVAIEPIENVLAFANKVVEVVLERGKAAFFRVIEVLNATTLRLSFTGWSRDVIPRAGTVFPTGCELKDESWIFGRLLACTGSVYGSAAGVNPHELPRSDDALNAKPGLLEKKVWELDDDAEERQRFLRNVTFGSKNEPFARESYTAFCLDEWLRAHYAAAGMGDDRYRHARAHSRVLEFGVLAMPGPQAWMRSSPDGVAMFLDVDGVFRLLFVEYKCPANLHSTDYHPYRKYPDNTPPYYKAQIQGGMGLLNEPANQAQWRRVLALTIENDANAITANAHAATAHDNAWAATAGDLVASLRATESAAGKLPTINTRFDTAHFVVWQRRQLWVTSAPYDDTYYRDFLLPRLGAWFDDFLTAMTRKFNGQLVRGEVFVLPPALVGDSLDAEDPDASSKLAARIKHNLEAATQARQAHSQRVAAAAAMSPPPVWTIQHLATRLRALAKVFSDDGSVAGNAALVAFAGEKDSSGRRKLVTLRQCLARIQHQLDGAFRDSDSSSEEEPSDTSETDESDSGDETFAIASNVRVAVDALCVLLKRSDGSWAVEQLRHRSSCSLEASDFVTMWFVADVERAVAAVFGEEL
jgi:hypothetical protein